MPVLMIALVIVTNLHAMAMTTNLCGFRRSLRHFATSLRIGLEQVMTSAAWSGTCRRGRRPRAIVLLPRIIPLSCGAGAKPVMAAASPDAILPSSGNSAINIARVTGL